MQTVKGSDIQERLLDFAVLIIGTCSKLPKNEAGKHIANQILRSGTSGASNYAESRGAESHRDFVHKLGIVMKELNETGIWLEMIKRSEMIKQEQLATVCQECDELSRIIGASIRTARKNG